MELPSQFPKVKIKAKSVPAFSKKNKKNAEKVRISFADDIEEDICIIDLIQPAMVSDAASE